MVKKLWRLARLAFWWMTNMKVMTRIMQCRWKPISRKRMRSVSASSV
jgi:hypothetical protein